MPKHYGVTAGMPEDWPTKADRETRKSMHARHANMRMVRIQEGHWYDDLEDSDNIDTGDSSDYTHEASGYVRVADGKSTATIVSKIFNTSRNVSTVEVLWAAKGSLTIDVSADDGTTWNNGITNGASVTLTQSGKKLRIRSNLTGSDQLESWSIHF